MMKIKLPIGGRTKAATLSWLPVRGAITNKFGEQVAVSNSIRGSDGNAIAAALSELVTK